MNKKIFLFATLVLHSFLNYSKEVPYQNIGPSNVVVKDFCLSEDGQSVYVAYANKVENYSISSNTSQGLVLSTDSIPIYRIDFEQQDSTLIAISKDGFVLINHLKSSELNTVKIDNYQLTSVIYSSAFKKIYLGTMQGTLLICNLAGKVEKEIPLHFKMITSLALSPDKLYIASSSMDGLVKTYNTSKDEVQTVLSSKRSIHSLAFDDETENLLIIDEKGTIYKENIYKKSWETLTSKHMIKSWGTGITSGPNKSYAICSTSGKIKIILVNGYSYSSKSKYIFTKIDIVPNSTKLIVIVQAYKGGLKLYKAGNMRFNT
jgi:WD40 repeat protein